MKILLAGPMLTSALQDETGIDLSGLPRATAQTPIGPIAGGLLKLGHEVHVLTLDAQIDQTATYHRGPLTVTYCPLRGAPRYKARVRMRDLFGAEIAFLSAEMQASDCDVVHAHWTYEYAEAAIRSAKPYVVTMHDLGWDYLFQFRDVYRLVRLLMKLRTMPRVRNLTVVSPFMVRKLWQYGFRGNVKVIPNPISAAACHPKDLVEPCIVAVGNDGRIKNIISAISAYKILKENHPNAELHLFGPGLDSAHPMVAADPGIYGHGNVPHAELMNFLQARATILFHPSRLETFGVILGEAKMRGVPVIAGRNSGGTVDVVGDFGILCNIEDPAEIASAALIFLKDPCFYQELQLCSHRDVSERYSVAAVTELYLSVYEDVIAAERLHVDRAVC